MSTAENNAFKSAKCILISLADKHSGDFSAIESFNKNLQHCGYYLEKISRVAYDNSEEIIRAIKEGVANYENVFLQYPAQMDNIIKPFVAELLNSQFDALGVLESNKITVFALYCDAQNRLNCEDISSILARKYGVLYDRVVIRTVGVSQKLFEEAIASAKDILQKSGADAVINVTDSYGDSRIEILFTNSTPKMAVDGAVRDILKRLNAYVYAVEDISLAEQLFRLLQLRRMKISVAESFTGGGVGMRLVEVSGISQVYHEGLNTYSNESKMQRLGVSEYTLKQHGAVSAETAREMASGLLATGYCDIAVATTGIAGPKSDNTKKPVGLAYIAVGCAHRDVLVYQFNFAGDRQNITQTAINQALFLAYKELK